MIARLHKNRTTTHLTSNRRWAHTRHWLTIEAIRPLWWHYQWVKRRWTTHRSSCFNERSMICGHDFYIFWSLFTQIPKRFKQDWWYLSCLVYMNLYMNVCYVVMYVVNLQKSYTLRFVTNSNNNLLLVKKIFYLRICALVEGFSLCEEKFVFFCLKNNISPYVQL